MYADDHLPPHFHILGPDFAVLVGLAELEILAGGARMDDIAEALDWAADNREFLASKWSELNERNI
jgi:hypothetical protein